MTCRVTQRNAQGTRGARWDLGFLTSAVEVFMFTAELALKCDGLNKCACGGRVLINLQPDNPVVKNHAKPGLRTAQRQFRNEKYFEGTRIALQVCKLLWVQGRYTFPPSHYSGKSAQF